MFFVVRIAYLSQAHRREPRHKFIVYLFIFFFDLFRPIGNSFIRWIVHNLLLSLRLNNSLSIASSTYVALPQKSIYLWAVETIQHSSFCVSARFKKKNKKKHFPIRIPFKFIENLCSVNMQFADAIPFIPKPSTELIQG